MADELPDTLETIELKAGRKYSFCTCGKSKSLPYCDNSHRKLNEKGCNYKSIKIIAEKDVKIKIHSSNWEK